jgi:RP/EB family microtubule-associated protein
MVANYKVLQELFNSEKITRNVDVSTLVKGRYMAALEMLQWIKNYFDQNFSGGDYDGPKRRSEVGIREPGDTSRRTKPSMNRTSTTTVRPVRTAPPPSAMKPKPLPRKPAETPRPPSAQLMRVKQELEEIKKENQTLLEERNFYYHKLQKVEVMCQEKTGDSFAEEILDVLYETDKVNGFVSPDELDI